MTVGRFMSLLCHSALKGGSTSAPKASSLRLNEEHLQCLAETRGVIAGSKALS